LEDTSQSWFGGRAEVGVDPAALVLGMLLVDMALAVLLVRVVLFGSLVIVNMALLVLVSFEDNALLDVALEVSLGLLHVDINMVLELSLDIGVQSRGEPWVLC
jgi:hypothetical protein